MEEGRSSRTAEYAAAFRALETVRRPARARLFEDPFAVRFLSPGLQRVVRLSAFPLFGPLIRWYVDFRWPGAMTSGIARTKLIDDLVAESVDQGIGQVLLLGAGFDCRAIRMPELAACRVIEVDHPATQAWKRSRLKELAENPPGNVLYLDADLTLQGLREVLAGSGLDSNRRSFVLWEGVTHYLGQEAVDATLGALKAVLAPGSRLVFTYLHGGLLDGTVKFDGAGASKKQVAGQGEPWIWGMDPEKMPGFLAARGYRLLQDQGAAEYREQYWGRQGRHMRGFAFYRVAFSEFGEKHGA